jgi:hypothetical protein
MKLMVLDIYNIVLISKAVLPLQVCLFFLSMILFLIYHFIFLFE